MRVIYTGEGEDCDCPHCGRLLFQTKPDEGWDGTNEEEWDESWLCRHVALVDFPQAEMFLVRDEAIRSWWLLHEQSGWDSVEKDQQQSDSGISYECDPDWIDEEYQHIAAIAAREKPEFSHFMISTLDDGGGPAPSWELCMLFCEHPWPTDEWL